MQQIFLWTIVFYLFFTIPIFGHGDLGEEIERVSMDIKNAPNNSRLYLKRGQLYTKHLEYTAAKSDLSKARQLDVHLVITDLLMAKIFSATHEPNTALAYINSFLKNQPNQPDGLIIRSGIFHQLQQETAAQKDLEVALYNLKSPSPKHYIAIAESFLRADSLNIAPALDWLEKGQNQFGFDIVLAEKKLALLIQYQRYNRALETIERLIVKFPRPEKWLFQKGEIFEKLDKIENARFYYQKTLESIDRLPMRLQMTKKMLALTASSIEKIQLM